MEQLRADGRDPFLQEKWDVSHYSADIRDNFEELEEKDVSIAGRIMAKRVMGKVSFIDIRTGRQNSELRGQRQYYAGRI